MDVGLPEGPSYHGYFSHPNDFLRCCPLNDRRMPPCSLFKIGRLFTLFSCLSLACVFLLLISSNLYPNPEPFFPCSVFAENLTWRGRSVHCCTCFKWFHLRFSSLSFSRFKSLDSSHSWSFPYYCVHVSSGDPTPRDVAAAPQTPQLGGVQTNFGGPS